MPAAMPNVTDIQQLGNAITLPNNINRVDALAKIFGAAANELSGQGVVTEDTVTTDPVTIQSGSDETDTISLIADLRRKGFQVILHPTDPTYLIRWPRT